MFERFTPTTRAVVLDAVHRARTAGSPQVEAEHLLGALLAGPTSDPLRELLGLSAAAVDGVLAEIDAAQRRAGLSPVDAEALALLGIDLDAVVDAVEAELGAGALARVPRRSGRGPRRTSFSPVARRALQRARRQAVLLGDPDLRPEHLLLGIVLRRGVIADALAAAGTTTATVHAALSRAHAPG